MSSQKQMRNNYPIEYEVTYSTVFENMNNQLHLAEGKHNTYLAANIALFIAMLAFFPEANTDFTVFETIFGFISLITLCIAMFFSLIAHFPRLEKPKYEDNLLFFEFCAQESTESFERKMNSTERNKWLAQQSIILAKITKKKYRLFGWAIFFSILSYLALVIAFISFIL